MPATVLQYLNIRYMKTSKLVIFASLTLFVALLNVSCKKEKLSNPIITVSPEPLYIFANVGDLVPFRIDISSEVKLSKVTITTQPDNQIPALLLDTAVTTRGATFFYYYRVPAAFAGKSVVFDFKVEDNNGLTANALKRVNISAIPTSSAVPLVETSGHRVYSNLSINPDAYNLETKSPEFSIVADSTDRDIQDVSGSNTTLSNTWKSPAGGKFVLFNGFDYANATDSSAYNAYTTGVKLSILYNIQVGDIIITKLGSTTANKYVVMRVTDLVDLTGKDGDYYEFTIKK